MRASCRPVIASLENDPDEREARKAGLSHNNVKFG
jgi:hypothetical protein